jgi:phage-related minor tail protein
MDDAERALVAKQKSFIKQGEKLQSLGKNMAAFITPAARRAGRRRHQGSAGDRPCHGQVNAALTSMGPVAGRTADQLKAAANAFEGSSAVRGRPDPDEGDGEHADLRQDRGAAFDRAQQAAINLSTRMGQDLQASAIQIGKALNDPIKGITSLTRVGIQFTDQQKEQIKAMVEAGNVAGAQKVILGELERQFGGAAQAAQDATRSTS